MLKVGIYTPYVRNEVTLAAVQFADWLVRCGIDVNMLSDGKIERGIHPVWDHKVRRGYQKRVYAWAYGATHLCWFTARLQALEWARLVGFDNPKRKTQNIFFPYWSQWSSNCDHFLMQSDRVICLSREMFDWLKRKRPPDKLLDSNRTWANLVCSDLMLLPKHGRIAKDKVSILSILTKTTSLDLGDEVLDVFDFLLHQDKHLSMTLLLERSLPRMYRRKINKLRHVYGDRLNCLTSLPYYQYVHEARKHDWIYLANTRHINGSLLSLLASSTVPIVCTSVPPVAAHLTNGSNGILIPSKVLQYTKQPIAHVDTDDIAKLLEETIERPSVDLKALQLNNQQFLQKKQEAFEQFIRQEFIA